jgi:hypothetical protein
MAAASITRQWADGSAMVVQIEVDGQHPDLLDELVRRVIALDADAPNTAMPSEDE